MELTLVEIMGYFGGAGGIFAVLCLVYYSKDRRWSETKMREDREMSETRLTTIITADQESREANTQALTALTSFLVRQNNGVK